MKRIFIVFALLIAFCAGCAASNVTASASDNEIENEIDEYVEKNKSTIAQDYMDEQYKKQIESGWTIEDEPFYQEAYMEGYNDGYNDALYDYGIEH